MASNVHIVGEAGMNHDAEYARAEQLVDIAVDSGCDSVKFQVIYPEGLYLEKVWEDGALLENEVFGIRERTRLPDSDYPKIARYAREKGTKVSASVFDKRGIDMIDELDPPYIKIASCDLNNSGLLKQVAERGRTMLISTGMSTLGEVEQAVEDVVATGNEDIVLLHCVSLYPPPVERMNMGFMTTLKQAFGCPVGFSDHTRSSICAIAAIALGATWLEKHYTYDSTAEGFDHANAMEPDQLAAYVADVRAAEAAMTPQHPKVSADEDGVAERARRGIFLARDVAAGQKITEADLMVVRPRSEFAPNELPLLLGKIAQRNLLKYEPVSSDQIG